MTILPETREALRDAVQRGAFVSPPRRRRRRVIAVGGTVAVLLGGGIAAAAGLWSPRLGGADDPVTRASTPIRVPTGGALHVLARPQTAADRGPDVERALTRLASAGLGEVDTTGVRRLATSSGGGVAILVPAGRTGPGGPADHALRRYRHLCVIYAAGTAAPQICGGAAELRAGKIAGFLPRDHGGIISGVDRTHVYGLVPDGVASVKVTLQDGTSIAAPVANNFYDAVTRSTAAPSDTTWLRADGSRIR
jgi:hypothetical protein